MAMNTEARCALAARVFARTALAAALTLGALSCGAQNQSTPPQQPGKPAAGTPKGEPYTPDRPTPEAGPDKEKEKRANTPPGKDRAGAAPAEGAIVDPAGVTK